MSDTKTVNIKDSGRGLPTTNTQTPMPETKPPKKTNSGSSSSSNKK